MERLTSVEKALDVLFHLSASGASGVSEIGRALELPKSTTHRLLAALGQRGLVERDAGGRYEPGIGLVALGLGVLDREPVVAAARPVLEREAEALGDTLFLAAARGGRLRVLDKVEGTGFLRAAPRVGSEVPADVTAAGKLHLAFAPDVLSPIPPSRGALAAEVARVKRRGWAENREQWLPGLAALAAPIFSGDRLVAALALAAPAARMPRGAARTRLAERLVAAAVQIEARLAGRPS